MGKKIVRLSGVLCDYSVGLAYFYAVSADNCVYRLHKESRHDLFTT